MKHILLLVCVGGLLGCASVEQTINTSKPRLLFQLPLPEFPKSITSPPSKLDIALLVAEDGSVLEAQLLKSSGDDNWDTEAKLTMLQWKFSPAYKNNKPIQLWLRLKAHVKYEEPIIISLAEILCETSEKADSIYKALKEGQDFGKLAEEHSIALTRNNKGLVGKVNLHSYTKEIKQALHNLSKDNFTQPLQYGDYYIILKKMDE